MEKLPSEMELPCKSSSNEATNEWRTASAKRCACRQVERKTIPKVGEEVDSEKEDDKSM